MTDETQGPESEQPATGQETSLGGASEWSTVVPPSSTPPASSPSAEPPASSFGEAAPTPALEPLPQPASYASTSTPTGPPLPPQPSSGSAPVGQQSYQPVYETGEQPPAYASAPGSGYPPQAPPPPAPGYGAPRNPGGPGYPPPVPPPAAGQGLSSNAAAAIAYITFIPAVIFLVMAPYNRDRFVRFHAWQCIALTVVAFIIAIVFSVLGIVGFHMLWWLFHSLIDLVLFVFWLIAIIKASQGQWYRIPVVGDLAQSFSGKDA